MWGKRLEDLPGSKNFFTAVAWASVTAVIPQISVSLDITCGMAVAFVFVFTLVFSKSVLSDTLDIQSDRLIGRETIPIVMGEGPARLLLQAMTVLKGGVLIGAFHFGCVPSVSGPCFCRRFYIGFVRDFVIEKPGFLGWPWKGCWV